MKNENKDVVGKTVCKNGADGRKYASRVKE